MKEEKKIVKLKEGKFEHPLATLKISKGTQNRIRIIPKEEIKTGIVKALDFWFEEDGEFDGTGTKCKAKKIRMKEKNQEKVDDLALSVRNFLLTTAVADEVLTKEELDKMPLSERLEWAKEIIKSTEEIE